MTLITFKEKHADMMVCVLFSVHLQNKDVMVCVMAVHVGSPLPLGATPAPACGGAVGAPRGQTSLSCCSSYTSASHHSQFLTNLTAPLSSSSFSLYTPHV